ncbi:MAG: GH92 family glycosyl hydrolase [Prevotella sp.]|nr:GH92 family glycosyl hydrolase [Prevotella sp.]
MKKTYFLLPVLLLVTGLQSCQKASSSGEDFTQYVEPRIGTAHCRYFHFAPGALPFGMAKPGPSTNGHMGNKDGWEASGYDYRDETIEGFPCVHEFQVGGITLMPVVGEVKMSPTEYRSHYSHDNEIAQPGYYSVLLDDYNVKAEVTATTRVAYERFTFPASAESRILFNIGSRMGESGGVKDAKVSVNDDGSVEGYVITLPEYVKKYQPGAEVPIYFYAQLDKKPTDAQPVNFRQVPNPARGEGEDFFDNADDMGEGLCLTFNTEEGEQVTAKIGVSYTSIENARKNLEEEGDDDFDEVKKDAIEEWNEHLGRIAVETDNREDKVKFYSGLYHALLGRGICSDVSGDYPKHDGTVGRVPLDDDGEPLYNMYNTDAMWGGQWNLTQVWAMAYPEHLSDFISSHLQVYKDAGWLGDGLANSRYVSGVGTNQLSLMIAAAYACGIRDFDLELAYEACRKNELDGENRPLGAGKSDTDQFVEYGYVPHAEAGDGPDETFMFSASHTLEYAFSAWATAQLAKALGHTEDVEKLLWLSKGWERIYDAETNFVRPRLKDGRFISDFDPMQVWRGFQEGNAWQYTFYAPHDAQALVAKVGADEFNARLDSIFTLSQPKIFSGGTEIGAFAGLRTLYNQGNQPCLHISWLFNEAGRPSLTQKWVRAILNEFYGTDGIHGYGYGQDEDQGQLGAWYVVSSLGLFDVAGLCAEQPSLGLGSTLFKRVTIRLDDDYYKGKTFVIETQGEGDYVQQYKLNGEELHATRLPFSDFARGGKLQVTLGTEPKDQY